jgi:hypothetical protein
MVIESPGSLFRVFEIVIPIPGDRNFGFVMREIKGRKISVWPYSHKAI